MWPAPILLSPNIVEKNLARQLHIRPCHILFISSNSLVVFSNEADCNAYSPGLREKELRGGEALHRLICKTRQLKRTFTHVFKKELYVQSNIESEDSSSIDKQLNKESTHQLIQFIRRRFALSSKKLAV